MLIHFSATASHYGELVTSKKGFNESYSRYGRSSDVKSDESRTKLLELGKSGRRIDVEERVKTGAHMASSLTDNTRIPGPALPVSMPSSILGNKSQNQEPNETMAVLDGGKKEQLSEGMNTVQLPDLEALGVTDAQGSLPSTELMRTQKLVEKILQKRKREK